MILSDSEIVRRMDTSSDNKIVIEPYPKPSAVQAASVDLHLADELYIFLRGKRVGTRISMVGGAAYYLNPGQFLLGSTIEHVEVPVDLAARVEGKSSLGRIGLLVHVTAGFVDPGFKGNITLELKNLSASRIRLSTGMPISQLCFERVSGPVARPYGSPGLKSHFQNSKGTIPSYLAKEEEDE